MKKPNLAVLIGESTPKHNEETETEDDTTVSEIKTHQHKVGEEFLKAVKEGNAAGMVEAFCAMHELDHAKWDKEEEEGETPEEEAAEHEEEDGETETETE